MDTNLQFGLVLLAAFVGAAFNNLIEWKVSKNPDGTDEKFSFKKFLRSLVVSLYAAVGVATAYQLKQVFGLPELIGAVMLGAAAQQVNNRIRDI